MSTSGANMSHAQVYRAQTHRELTRSLRTMTHGQKNQKILTQYREIQDLNDKITRQATEIDTLERQHRKKKLRIKDLKDNLDFKTDYVRTLIDRLKYEGENGEQIMANQIARLREELDKKDRAIRDMELMATFEDFKWAFDEGS